MNSVEQTPNFNDHAHVLLRRTAVRSPKHFCQFRQNYLSAKFLATMYLSIVLNCVILKLPNKICILCPLFWYCSKQNQNIPWKIQTTERFTQDVRIVRITEVPVDGDAHCSHMKLSYYGNMQWEGCHHETIICNQTTMQQLTIGKQWEL